MSMIGYILGWAVFASTGRKERAIVAYCSFYSLGDRHGENILFDGLSGDTVHVDLNCLFEKVCLKSRCKKDLVKFEFSRARPLRSPNVYLSD